MTRDFDCILLDWETYHEYAGQLRLRGAAMADVKGRFINGEVIITSELQHIKNGIATTKSGTRYLLVI